MYSGVSQKYNKKADIIIKPYQFRETSHFKGEQDGNL